MTENMAARGEGLAGLVAKWRKHALGMVPPEYAKRNMHQKYLKMDNVAAGIDECADELEIALAAPAGTAHTEKCNAQGPNAECICSMSSLIEQMADLPDEFEERYQSKGAPHHAVSIDSGVLRRVLDDLAMEMRVAALAPICDYISVFDNSQKCTRKKGHDGLHSLSPIGAALATPSPQAPRPDCELLSSPNSVLAFDAELNPEQEQEQCNAFSTTSAREQPSATASDSLDVAAQIILKQHWPSVRNMEENEARQREVKRIIEVIEQCTWQAAKEESDKWYEACRNPRADDPRAYCISRAVRK